MNAAEWGKCERLETEKMALERETRKYKIQVDELESTLSRKNRQIKATFDSDMRSLQSEVHDKTQVKRKIRINNTYDCVMKCAGIARVETRAGANGERTGRLSMEESTRVLIGTKVFFCLDRGA